MDPSEGYRFDRGTVGAACIYLVLILLVIGAMFLHNAIIWRSKAVARRRMQNPMMVRMTTNQRWQHLILLTSFIILVITGFALKFPDSWFAELLGMGERLRSIVHRVAGVVLISAGIYHVFYRCGIARGTAVDSRPGAGAKGRIRCVEDDALLPWSW